MNVQPVSAPSTSPRSAGASGELRGPELGPALKRDRLLQQVRAARKRLRQDRAGTLARLR